MHNLNKRNPANGKETKIIHSCVQSQSRLCANWYLILLGNEVNTHRWYGYNQNVVDVNIIMKNLEMNLQGQG